MVLRYDILLGHVAFFNTYMKRLYCVSIQRSVTRCVDRDTFKLVGQYQY